MKNRTIPYGYAFENGKTVIHADESGIVSEIFRSYLAGQPLSAIASGLNSRRIEYMPGTVGWDKARLKRILDDRRYIGEKGFPQIIGSDDFEKAQRVKSEKARSVNTRKEDAGYQIKLPVLCPHCHEKMQRKCNNRLRKKVKWKCGNGHTVYLDDESLLDGLDESRIQQLIAEKNELQAKLGEIDEERGRQQTVQDRLETIYTVLDGLKNRPMTYDDEVVRQLIECVVVESKDRIKVVFCGGLQVEQQLRQEDMDFLSEMGQIPVNI